MSTETEKYPGGIMSDEQNEDNCLKNQIPSKFYRMATESKMLLKDRGDMYIGTGTPQRAEITIQVTEDGVEKKKKYYVDIPVTGVLKAPTENGQYYLTCTVTDDGPELEWRQLPSNNTQ